MLKEIYDVIKTSWNEFWDNITPEETQKMMEVQSWYMWY